MFSAVMVCIMNFVNAVWLFLNSALNALDVVLIFYLFY